MQRRHHYEVAFEEHLRVHRIPYVAVNEARKALLPEGAAMRAAILGDAADAGTLKSFDMVIYGHGSNLLVEVKGRRVGRPSRAQPAGPPVYESRTEPLFQLDRPARARAAPRLESWVTRDDVESLAHWQKLFGGEFEAAFVFVYWCEEMPPDGLFHEVFEHAGRWYSLRAVRLADYLPAMKTRSAKWRTVHVPPAAFERICRPFAPPRAARDFSADTPVLDPL
jgi:hypothetical protein